MISQPGLTGRVNTPRPLGTWAFVAVAITSFGGPLALAALAVPGVLADASDSAGLTALAGALVFALPLAIWLGYSRHISSSGGLAAFVEAAAGRRVALLQGTVWTFSYVLYLVYTTTQIVYDLLPTVVPGEHNYQTVLTLLIPLGLASAMLAGRGVVLAIIGVMAAGQLALAGVLDAVTLAHVPTPVSSLGAGAPAGPLTKASAQTALFYICGSLPLFLGGEVARPRLTLRRGLVGSYLLTALLIGLAVAPLAAAPGLTHTALPGMSVAQQFAGPGLARAIGIGVAVSTAGVMLCEYLALTRLVPAITSWRQRPVAVAVAAVMLLAAPVSLINPEGFYSALLKPSLIMLWISQLIVFAVYPRFAIKHRRRALPAWAFSLGASALALYGLWSTLHQAAT